MIKIFLTLVVFLTLFLIPSIFAETLTIQIPEGDHDKGLRTAIDWYVPRTHSISVGTEVMWINQDFTPHTVTSGKGISSTNPNKGMPDSYFDSGIIDPQESWSFTFPEPGGFSYFCSIHPWIQRSITVLEPELYVLPPLQQIADGIEPYNVQCKSDLYLVFRSDGFFPACVKTDSVQKLIARGWATAYDPFPLTNLVSDSGIYATLQGEDAVSELTSKSFWPAGPKMTYLDVSSEGSLVLATSSEGNKVYAIDIESGETRVIPVGQTPKGVKINHDGKLAFVANEGSGTVSVIDLEQFQVIKEIDVGLVPHNIVFHPNSKLAYVTVQGSDEVAILDVRQLEKTDSIPVGKMPHNLDLTPDARYLFVTNIVTNDVAVIDLQNNEIVKRIPVSKGHHGIDIPQFGDLIFVSGIGDDKVNVIDASSLELVKQIEVGDGPHGIRANLESTKVYVGITSSDEVVVIDTKTLEIINRETLGKSPFWIAVSGNQ